MATPPWVELLSMLRSFPSLKIPSLILKVLPATYLQTLTEKLLCDEHLSMHWDPSKQDGQASDTLGASF